MDEISFFPMLSSHFDRQEKETILETPARPNKRPNSALSMEMNHNILSAYLTPKQSNDGNGPLHYATIPKTPMAPRPKYCQLSTNATQETITTPPTPCQENDRVFLPDLDAMVEMPSAMSLGETPLAFLPTVAASRLQPRPSSTVLSRGTAPFVPTRRHSTPETSAMPLVASYQPNDTVADTTASPGTTSGSNETKGLPEGQSVPIPTLRKSLSWHALCA